jgi:hypothetical protein
MLLYTLAALETASIAIRVLSKSLQNCPSKTNIKSQAVSDI